MSRSNLKKKIGVGSVFYFVYDFVYIIKLFVKFSIVSNPISSLVPISSPIIGYLQSPKVKRMKP
jgi:hypothetical protein